MYTYCAKVIRVIDGATLDAEIDLGFGVSLTQRVKLYGINTADMNSSDSDEKKKSKEAREHLSSILTTKIIVNTILNRRGKVGRVLGIVYIEDSERIRININEKMVNDGFATEYPVGK